MTVEIDQSQSEGSNLFYEQLVKLNVEELPISGVGEFTCDVKGRRSTDYKDDKFGLAKWTAIYRGACSVPICILDMWHPSIGPYTLSLK